MTIVQIFVFALSLFIFNKQTQTHLLIWANNRNNRFPPLTCTFYSWVDNKWYVPNLGLDRENCRDAGSRIVRTTHCSLSPPFGNYLATTYRAPDPVFPVVQENRKPHRKSHSALLFSMDMKLVVIKLTRRVWWWHQTTPITAIFVMCVIKFGNLWNCKNIVVLSGAMQNICDTICRKQARK